MEEDTYKLAAENGDQRRYTSTFGPAIVVSGSGSERIITLDGKIQVKIVDSPEGIRKPPKMLDRLFLIDYPGDIRFRVELTNDQTLIYDSNGKLYFVFVTAYTNGQPDPSLPVWNRFPPYALIKAAYPELHERRGQPLHFILGLLVLVFGWCEFRYERFQHLSYWLSLRWVGTDNPEPNDTHFFLCKIGGIFMMLFSVYLFFKSFGLSPV
ncbi:hypothetical protein [Paenibacillus herberti]|uniref:DUF6199 domain-containing protein n=1 Tax=Paenibacillus herberti TaxID=1619309 RepID=A0A229NZN4_9BACL|nr:hypothetical protein [Paenibacillus herberti]OXM15496.1 hypothetical protein CGZ75_01790 [Paenibacillus herberti]